MKYLRGAVLWIVLIMSVGFWYYVDQDQKSVCRKPLRYTVTAYDSRFNLSKEDFIEAIRSAELLWEDAYGRDLFVYTPYSRPHPLYESVGKYFLRGVIGVELVYDARQQTSEMHRISVSKINAQKSDADSVEFQFKNLQAQHREAETEYKIMLEKYNSRAISFEKLEAKRSEVNSLAQQVNALIKKYNMLVGELNSVVREVNANAGHEFEEGQYLRDRNGERISIYEFGDVEDLVRVLAHEFGHALGLDHNDNPDSIMYYLNNSSNMKPTEEDFQALDVICKGK